MEETYVPTVKAVFTPNFVACGIASQISVELTVGGLSGSLLTQTPKPNMRNCQTPKKIVPNMFSNMEYPIFDMETRDDAGVLVMQRSGKISGLDQLLPFNRDI